MSAHYMSPKGRSFMSYQGPMLIREPELRWPVILTALIITTLVVLVTAGAISMALRTPAAPHPVPPPPLEGALRPEMPASWSARGNSRG